MRELPGVAEAVVVLKQAGAARRLVGYVVGSNRMEPSAIRDHLGQRLPAHMVPSGFVWLDRIPLTANGKVDRLSLPEPESDEQVPPSEAARTPAEAALADVWKRVLKVEHVGVGANFFELGGDSILCIQLVAKAAQAGLRLTPRQIFEHPTLEAQAQIAGLVGIVSAEQGLVEGDVELTPIQSWFLETHTEEPHHYNQSVLLETSIAFERELLDRATSLYLSITMPPLRTRFVLAPLGWRQYLSAPGSSAPTEWLDLGEVSDSELAARITLECGRLQASLDPERGPLFRVAYFDLGPGRGGRLLLIVHHLVMDGVSWRIITEDFQAVYEQLARGESPSLPAKTTSYREWAKLRDYAESPAVLEQVDFWTAATRAARHRLPVHAAGGANATGQERSVSVALDERETAALLGLAASSYRSDMTEILLASAARGDHPAIWRAGHLLRS